MIETFAQETYWLFGSEACSICRSHEQSNIDGKIDHVGVDEIANQILDEHFNLLGYYNPAKDKLYYKPMEVPYQNPKQIKMPF